MYASIRKIDNILTVFDRFAKYQENKDNKAVQENLTNIDRAPGSGNAADLVAHQQGMCRCDGAGDFVISGSVRNQSSSSNDHPYFYIIENWQGSKKVNGNDYYAYIVDSSDHAKYTHPGGIQVAENVLCIGTEDYRPGQVETYTSRSRIRFYDVGDTRNITEYEDWRINRDGDNKCASAVGLTKTEYGQWILAIRGNDELEIYVTTNDTTAGDKNKKFSSIAVIRNDKTNNLKNFQGINLFLQKGSTDVYLIGTNPEGAAVKDMLYLYRINLKYYLNSNQISSVESVTHLKTYHLYSYTSAASFKWAACTFIDENGNFIVYDTTMHVDDRIIKMNKWDTKLVQNNLQPMPPGYSEINTSQGLISAINAIPEGKSGTIKLQKSITCNNQISVTNKTITINLDDKVLNVSPGANTAYGLYASNSTIKLEGATSGAFNITGAQYGVYATGNSSVEVSSATGDSGGARAVSGAAITVNAYIAATSNEKFVTVGGTIKRRSQFASNNTKPGYLSYSDGTSTIWVKDFTVGYECLIVETEKLYAKFTEALSFIPFNNLQVIKLLRNVNLSNGLNITDKAISFDLNGKILNIETALNGGNGIEISNGQIKLADHTITGGAVGGQINVLSPQYAINAVNGSTVEVTNVKGGTAFGGNLGAGIVASGGGVRVAGGSKVTVNGNISAFSGAAYIKIENTKKIQAQSASTTTKAGYATYTDGASTVWANINASGNDFIVNRQAYVSRGNVTHHEMHRATCTNLPSIINRYMVGLQPSPNDAIQAARKSFVSSFEGAVIDGCFICCNEMHTM